MASNDEIIMCADPYNEKEDSHYLWGYKGCHAHNPESWNVSYPHANRKHQSPIKIDTLNVHRDFKVRNKICLNIQRNLINCETIIRTPHNFAIKIEGGGYIKSGPINSTETYRFGLVQFHCDENGGSEHIIDNFRYPVECHMTFWNTKYFSLSEAANHQDGLVILAIFYNIEYFANSTVIDEILRAYYSLDTRRYSHQLWNNLIDLSYLVPHNLDDYYCYHGSMTTPPCAESVFWIILKQPMTMRHDQMEHLLKIHRERGCCKNGSTVRPPQELNGRAVRSSVAVNPLFCYK